MARRLLPGLERALGPNALVSTAYGNVGSSIYFALGIVASYALGLTPLVFLITGFFFMCTAATYAEATAMYPEAGGASSFARRAFNEFWSFVAAWGQMLSYVITVAISAFFLPHYVGGMFDFAEPLRSSPGDVIFGSAVIALLVAINVSGVRESAGIRIVLAVVDFLSQLMLVLVGALLVLSPETLVGNVRLGVAPTWEQFLLAIPIGMIAYTGIETISNMADEARDEARTIPMAINRVQMALFAIYFTLPAVALSALPVERDPETGEYRTLLGVGEEEGGYSGNPILGVVKELELGPLQAPGELYFGLVATIILFLAANAGLIGISRLVYSMGIHRQLPDRMRRLHPRFRAPWIGVTLFGGVAILTLLPGEADFLAQMYAFGAMLSFTIAHLSVMRLRATQPDHPRPDRGLGNVRVRGYDLPLFALVGALATGMAFLVVTILNPVIAAAGTAWLAVGIAVYLVYRRRQGLDLTATRRMAVPTLVTDHEAEYESVLVHFDAAGGYDAEVVSTAAKLAARRRRGIHVLVTVAVPRDLPIDAPLPRQEAHALSLIEQARVQAGNRVSGHLERIRAGQAGRRIIDEARQMRAAAVVMPLPRRVPGSSVFGRTLETVLNERPCRVIIQSAQAPPARGRLLERSGGVGP